MVVIVAWACVAIPGLIAAVAADLYVTLGATFGGLFLVVVFLAFRGRRR